MPEPAARIECDLIFINRQQCFLRTVDVELLVPADHVVRLFWDVTGKLDLSAFYADIKTKRGRAGRPAFDPRLLITVWLYAYKRGIGSAREIERMCQYDPGMQWLTALTTINHHWLSDFRIDHDEALKGLFQQVLAMLLLKRMITLERVTQDGTRILARLRNSSLIGVWRPIQGPWRFPPFATAGLAVLAISRIQNLNLNFLPSGVSLPHSPSVAGFIHSFLSRFFADQRFPPQAARGVWQCLRLPGKIEKQPRVVREDAP